MSDSASLDPARSTSEDVQRTQNLQLNRNTAELPAGQNNTQEIIERLRSTELLLEDDEQFDSESQGGVTSTQVLGTEGDIEADDEQSIRQYMQDLLARSNGTSTQPLPAVEERRKTEVVESVRRTSRATQQAAARRQKPEGRDELSNMRQLANINARNAILTHNCRQLIDQMRGKLFLALLSIVISLGLAWISTVPFSATFLVAVAASVAGAVWTVQFLKLGRQLSSGDD